MAGILIISCLFSSWKAHGQSYNELGMATETYYKNYSVLNPAAIGTNYPIELFLNYKGLTGVFSQVRSYCVGGSLRINEKNNQKNKQILGFTFLGNHEGEFISRTRLYVNYAYHINIKEKYFLSAASSLGLVSYAYKSSTASPGGSSNVATGNVGLWFYKENLHIGLSSDDVSNSKLHPIDAAVILKRFYTSSIDYRYDISIRHSIVPLAQVIYFGNNYLFLNAGASFVYKNLISIGMLYKTRQGTLVTLGFERIPLFNGESNAYFSYKVPFRKASILPVSIFEINLLYSRNKQVKMTEEDFGSRGKKLKLSRNR